jgi:hypothetical protein
MKIAVDKTPKDNAAMATLRYMTVIYGSPLLASLIIITRNMPRRKDHIVIIKI